MDSILTGVFGGLGLLVAGLPYAREWLEKQRRRRYAQFIGDLFILRVRVQQQSIPREQKKKEFKEGVERLSRKLFGDTVPPRPRDSVLSGLVERLEPLEFDLPCQLCGDPTQPSKKGCCPVESGGCGVFCLFWAVKLPAPLEEALGAGAAEGSSASFFGGEKKRRAMSSSEGAE